MTTYNLIVGAASLPLLIGIVYGIRKRKDRERKAAAYLYAYERVMNAWNHLWESYWRPASAQSRGYLFEEQREALDFLNEHAYWLALQARKQPLPWWRWPNVNWPHKQG